MARVEIDEELELDVTEFLALAQRVWPRNYDPSAAAHALRATINITARESRRLVGCLRILTDGYFFSTIPEMLVDPEFQRRGIGRALLEAAWSRSPTSLALGAQPGNETFFVKCGFEPGIASFERRKPRGGTPAAVRCTIEIPE